MEIISGNFPRNHKEATNHRPVGPEAFRIRRWRWVNTAIATARPSPSSAFSKLSEVWRLFLGISPPSRLVFLFVKYPSSSFSGELVLVISSVCLLASIEQQAFFPSIDSFDCFAFADPPLILAANWFSHIFVRYCFPDGIISTNFIIVCQLIL